MSGDSGALDRVRRWVETWGGLPGDIRIAEDVPVTLGDLRELLHMASEGVR